MILSRADTEVQPKKEDEQNSLMSLFHSSAISEVVKILKYIFNSRSSCNKYEFNRCIDVLIPRILATPNNLKKNWFVIYEQLQIQKPSTKHQNPFMVRIKTQKLMFTDSVFQLCVVSICCKN